MNEPSGPDWWTPYGFDRWRNGAKSAGRFALDKEALKKMAVQSRVDLVYREDFDPAETVKWSDDFFLHEMRISPL